MRWFIAFLIVVSSGCTATYKQNSLVEPKLKMESNQPVVIQVPADGAYGSKTYKNSGRMVANAIREAIIIHSKQATIDDDKALSSAVACRYQVNSTILHWEDRATEWSGKPDQISVQIDVFDVQSRDKIASAVIEGKSKWATFGGDHPQDLLLAPLQQYFDCLYGTSDVTKP